MEVQPNKIYRIQEKVTSNTPSGLKERGRFKMVGDTSEPAKCKYVGNSQFGHYDTGLDESSLEFNGKSKQEVTKILKDRKTLIDHFNRKKEAFFKSNPSATETQFVSLLGVEMRHDTVIDTSSLDNYLNLFLALRGNKLTPESEINNPLYNSSFYVLKDTEGKEDNVDEFLEKKLAVNTWFGSTVKDNSDKVKEYLQYVGALSIGRKASLSVLMGIFDHFISDVSKLEKLYDAITKDPYEKVKIINKVRKLKKSKVITVSAGIWYFEGEAIGRSDEESYSILTKEGNENLLDTLIDK